MGLFEAGVQASLDYLVSEGANRSLAANAYWPKWDSPWWHITLLREMGEAKRIPKSALRAMVGRLRESRLTIFPIHPGELPEGTDANLDTHCHCALGNIYCALAAAGADVDGELPWIREWFLRYPLPDGGFNCDNQAYLKTPPPSSMVGTIAPLEAVLLFTPRPLTEAEANLVDRGARCLLERKLMHATTNPHNSEERADEDDWRKLCFPRFYLYDVLRGLSFVLKWASLRNQSLPRGAIREVYASLNERFAGGQVRIERTAYEGIATRLLVASVSPRKPATFFPLLEQVSRVGEVSPFLSAEWQECLRLERELTERKLIV